MEKSFIKKQTVLKAIGAITLSFSLIFGSTVLFSTIKTKDYSDDSQIKEISDSIDGDLTYFKEPSEKKITRMKHNNDEPIYVSISDAYTDEEKAYINWSLDYVFGVVGDINSHYRYEIVDESERAQHSKLGKTTICYNVKEINYETKVGLDRANGSIICEKDTLSKLAGKSLYKSYSINYDREIHANDTLEQKQYTFLHELLHAFGFADVYNTTAQYSYVPRFCGNTIMNTKIGNKINCLTPNDYRCLISTYAPKMDQDKLIEFIKEYKQKTTEYDETYYKAFSALCEYNLKTESTLDTSKSYSLKYQFYSFDNENTIVENISIKVEDGKFKIIITDKNGTILDQAEGETFDTGNSLVLKNVNLKRGLRPLTGNKNINDYINDFVLIKKDKRYVLYDISSNQDINLSAEIIENNKNNESNLEQ